MQNFGVFSKPQVLNLRRALTSIQLAGTEGFDHAVVMPGDVIDILLRCEAVQQMVVDGPPCSFLSREKLPLVHGHNVW